MSIFNALNISTSGMTAQRLRMDVISENIANVSTTRTSDGTPYRRKEVVFAEKANYPTFAQALSVQMGADGAVGKGVKVSQITEDTTTPERMVYEPSHPDADENGYVSYPNVNTVTEMTDLIDASRAYEANTTAFNASKSIALLGLQIGE